MSMDQTQSFFLRISLEAIVQLPDSLDALKENELECWADLVPRLQNRIDLEFGRRQVPEQVVKQPDSTGSSPVPSITEEMREVLPVPKRWFVLEYMPPAWVEHDYDPATAYKVFNSYTDIESAKKAFAERADRLPKSNYKSPTVWLCEAIDGRFRL